MNVKLTVDGAEQELDLAEILTIRNPEAERMEVSVHLAYWGAIFGAKLEEEELADAYYRQWHGETIKTLLSSEEKSPAEWKVKAVIEAHPSFIACKERIAASKREVATAKAIFDSYSRKADILARLIAREDTERVRANVLGRESHDSAAGVKAEERNAKVAEAVAATRMKKTKTK